GNFGPPAVVNVPSGSSFVGPVIADFNSDAKLDVAVVDATHNGPGGLPRFHVTFGDGLGGFGATVSTSFEADDPFSVEGRSERRQQDRSGDSESRRRKQRRGHHLDRAVRWRWTLHDATQTLCQDSAKSNWSSFRGFQQRQQDGSCCSRWILVLVFCWVTARAASAHLFSLVSAIFLPTWRWLISTTMASSIWQWRSHNRTPFRTRSDRTLRCFSAMVPVVLVRRSASPPNEGQRALLQPILTAMD